MGGWVGRRRGIEEQLAYSYTFDMNEAAREEVEDRRQVHFLYHVGLGFGGGGGGGGGGGESNNIAHTTHPYKPG